MNEELLYDGANPAAQEFRAEEVPDLQYVETLSGTELFSFFTADIIRQESLFTR